MVIGSPHFRACESAKGTPGSCTGSGRARKSTKKPLPYAWLAIKPDNVLSSVISQEEQLREPLTLHRVPGRDE